MTLVFALLALLSSAADNQELLRRGLLELQQRQLGAALADLEAASKSDAGNPLVWTSLAQLYWRLDRKPQALQAAERARSLGEENPVTAHALAMFYNEVGDYRRAAEMEAVFAASPQADRGAEARTAELFVRAGEPDRALTAAEKAVARDPSPANQNQLGRVLVAAKQPDRGLGALAAAWKAEPANEQFCFDYAQALLRRQEFMPAEQVLTRGVAEHPASAQLRLAEGVAFYGNRKFEEAIAAFLATIRIDPTVRQPYLFLGKLLDQAGPRMPDLVAAFRRWHEQNPADGQTSLVLAKALAASGGDAAEIEALLRRSIRDQPQAWEPHYELGQLLARRRQFAEAATELTECIRLGPGEAMPHYHLARVYDRLGEPQRAQAEREAHARLLKSAGIEEAR